MVEPDVLELFKTQTEQQKLAFEGFAKTTIAKGGVQALLDEYNNELRNYKGPDDKIEKTAFDQNPGKNRYKDVPCRDTTRVVLNDGKGADYIHANVVQALQTSFIATQGPTPATVTDFWRMVDFHKLQCIVMLCDFVECGKKKSEVYLPRSPGDPMVFGDLKVEFVELTAMDSHIDRTTVRLYSANSAARDIRYYHYKSWPDKHVPKSTRGVLRLLTYVRSIEKPCVVHCSAGIGRTGTMIAVEMCLQQLLLKGQVDVLDVCKRLRDQRACSVQVEQQYVIVCFMVLEYGVALKLINDPSLLEQLNKMKTDFEALPGPQTPNPTVTVETSPGPPKPRVRKVASNVYFPGGTGSSRSTKKTGQLAGKGGSPRKKPSGTRRVDRSRASKNK